MNDNNKNAKVDFKLIFKAFSSSLIPAAIAGLVIWLITVGLSYTSVNYLGGPYELNRIGELILMVGLGCFMGWKAHVLYVSIKKEK